MKTIIYMTDELIYIKTKKEEIIKSKIPNNIISMGKIINIPKFLSTFNKIIEEQKLNQSLFGDSIKVLINPDYTNTDINVLKNIFLSFNYRKISFEKITKYYKLNTTNAYINIFDNYIIITYLDIYKKTNNYIIPTRYFKNNLDLMHYIKYLVEEREIYLLGKGELLMEVFDNFENTFTNKTYIFSQNETYVISKAK